MTIFSKYRSRIATTIGAAACGGLSVYYGLEKLHIFPTSKWDNNWDKRDPKSLLDALEFKDSAKQKESNEKVNQGSRALRHVILIRHGQYNLAGRTDAERTLTALGEKQALATGKRLKDLDFPYTRIVRSTMTRATQTAKLIEKSLPKIPVQDDQLLEEGAPCRPEPEHPTWRPDLQEFFRDGPRIEAAFRKYIHRAPLEQEQDTYDIVVCHGNVIRYFVCRALQIPASAWLRFAISHASITWLVIAPSGRVYLKGYSDVGHMPPEMITNT